MPVYIFLHTRRMEHKAFQLLKNYPAPPPIPTFDSIAEDIEETIASWEAPDKLGEKEYGKRDLQSSPCPNLSFEDGQDHSAPCDQTETDGLPPTAANSSSTLFLPCDVTLKVGKQKIQSNRQVLASAIPYFDEIFKKNKEEVAHLEIALKGFDPTAMKCLIDYVHSGNLQIAQDQVQSLLIASVFLKMDHIIDACLQYLSMEMVPENALSFRARAVHARSAKWQKKADHYIGQNFEELCLTEEFLNLSFLAVKDLVCRNDLEVVSEETVVESVIRWIKVSPAHRRVTLPKLLRHVRLPLLSQRYLSELQCKEELIWSSELCNKIVNDALIYVARNDAMIYEARNDAMISLPTVEEPQRATVATRHRQCVRDMGFGMYSICREEDDTVSIRYYNEKKSIWAVLDEVPVSNSEYVICTKDIIYFVGGNCRSTLVLKNLLGTNNIPMKHSVPAGAGICFQECKTYFFGNARFSNSAEVVLFDPLNCTCQHVGNMLEGRIDPGVVSLEGVIYVTGGCNSTTVLSSAETYNPLSRLSRNISPMLNERSGHGCATLSGEIYVCGGDPHGNTFTGITAEVYQPKTNQWTAIGGMNNARFCKSLFSVGDKLYAVDADPDAEEDIQVEVFDPMEREWRCSVSIPSSNEQGFAVVCTNSAVRLRSR